jgi:zinc resistance-associated protein
MWKTLLAGTTAIVIASGTHAIAQTAPGTAAPSGQQTAQPSNQNTNRASAALDARMARIKARLRLTPEQEANWPAVEAAIRDIVKERATRISERRAARETTGAPRPDVIERMRQRADALTTRGADLKKLADASEPLYKSLSDNQKRRLVAMLRNAGPSGERGWRGEERRFGDGRRFGEGGRFDQRQWFGHRSDRGYYGYPDRYVR